MASSKRIGFFWSEEKITIVEFDKNTPLLVASSLLPTKNNSLSPFSSALTEEIQITANVQKLLKDNRITNAYFYVSLPMKEIVLRSFIIPLLKPDEVQNAIKFEAKKYIPFDIQELAYVYYTIPVVEDKVKRLQVIFFAARKDVLARYDRVFAQVNARFSFCEPYMVSLTKALLFKKEVKPTDHFAFLELDQNIGRICFIDKGIPQFIREFPVSSANLTAETSESLETLNSKIINEVANSFDFYARQFNGEKIDQMLVSSGFAQADLLSALETEIKVKIIKFSQNVLKGEANRISEMDAVYAMGACVTPSLDALSEFNFLGDRSAKSKIKNQLLSLLKSYRDIMIVFAICVFSLALVYLFFQAQSKLIQSQYDQLSSRLGGDMNVPLSSIQSDIQQNTDLLAQYKNIRMNSNLAFILFKVSSHLQPGTLLNSLSVKYVQDNSGNTHMVIDMSGDVLNEGLSGQIAAVNQLFSDFKNDKELARYVNSVNMSSLRLEQYRNRQVTGFTIHCS